MTALLELTGVGKRFTLPSGERLEILNDLDLTIRPGEVTAIVGRSGSGKSTLLNILGLLEQPSSGTFLCEGSDVARMRDAKRSRLRGEFLGFIFQQFHLLDRRTALENVAEPLLYGSDGDLPSRMRRAASLLDEVGLAERPTRCRTCSAAASSNGSRSHGRWCAGHGWCWPTSQPARWTPRLASGYSTCC